MKRFKFRAECRADVSAAVAVLVESRALRCFNTEPVAAFPDVVVSLVVSSFKDFDIEDIRDLLRKVEDGHVMVETLDYADKYTGERKG